jgi:hypothetical protein
MADVKETVEVLDLCISLLDKLAAAKADDGKVDLTEIIGLALSLAQSALKAAMGLDKIGGELKELSSDEVKLLVDKGVAVASAAMKLIGLSK